MDPNVTATVEFSHANFGDNKLTATLSKGDAGIAMLTVEAPDGRIGEVQLQPQDNGNLVIRVHLAETNPVHVLILEGASFRNPPPERRKAKKNAQQEANP